MYGQSIDQPGMFTNPPRGQPNRENEYFPVPVPALDFGLAKRFRQSRTSLLIFILRLKLVLTYGIPPEFRGGVHLFILNRHTPSGQSRVYRVSRIGVPMAFTAESPPAQGQ